jgi:N-acetylglucosaminyldiphosphoundecaprenol N-acetyl-beta-D-mannosaminyltransferase
MSEQSAELLGSRIDAITWEQAGTQIMQWASKGSSRMVCACNVHTLVTARADAELSNALALADIRTPDGAPVAWLMRRLGWPEQQRISGPDLMWYLLGDAQRLGIPIFLLGSTPHTLDKLSNQLRTSFPQLILAGTASPPFRTMDQQENDDLIEHIRTSGARLVFVGLGCPKQEKWMAQQNGRLPVVMIGVGAAFDYHAGTLPRAPASWQYVGLEWLYRLVMEPARLCRRYVVTNTVFLLSLPGQLWKRTGL